MSQNEALSGALGLDVGTSRIVAAHRSGSGYSYDAQLNAALSAFLTPSSRWMRSCARRFPARWRRTKSSFTAMRARSSPDC